MKIIDYANVQCPVSNDKKTNAIELATATLLFLVPVLVLFLLAK